MTAQDYQLDWNGAIVVGDGTLWEIDSWAGLEELTTRGTDVPQPQAWGSIPGSSYVDARVVTIVIESDDPSNMLVAEAAFLPPSESAPDLLSPMRVKFPNREEFLIYGRVARRVRSRDVESTFGVTKMTIEFEFPDPRLYSAVLQQASLTVFVAGSLGLKMSLGAGADLGVKMTLGSGVDLGVKMIGVASTGLSTITNLGYIDAYPIITFSPATGISSFSVTNQTTGQVFTVNQTVSPGQTLIADMQAAKTGMSNGAAALPMSIGGSSVFGSWVPPRTPLRLIPGANVLRFDVTVGDPAATALVTAPSAYL